MSNSYLFQKRAKEEILQYEKDVFNRVLSFDDIEVVFQAYVLGFLKATFVVAHKTEGRYYEASLNTKTNKLFIDIYTKEANLAVDFNGGNYND